jgi:hypothetical protein
VEFFFWAGVVSVALAGLGFAAYRGKLRKHSVSSAPPASPAPQEPVEENVYKISYAPSDIVWSGSGGALPLKTLTYKQYECLEDARYGFKIVGVTPSERKDVQPHKTRAHGQKTVASLAKHKFLTLDGENTFAITDLGLNALATCAVRY